MPMLTLMSLIDEFPIKDFKIILTFKTGKVMKYSSKVRKLKNQLLAIIYDNNLNPERVKVTYFEWVNHAEFIKIQCEEI